MTVTICCITYNHERYIRETLEGFLSQRTDFEFEVIVHDDASTDGTAAIVREIATRDKRVRPIIREKNLRSTGVQISPLLFQMARSKYIALCEGDDHWTDPQKLQRQVEWMEKNPDCNLTFHDVRIVDETGKFQEQELYSDFPWNGLDRSKLTYTKEDLLNKTLCPTCSVVYRKPVGPMVPSWQHQLPFGDQPLFIHVLGEGQIKYFNETWAVYRRHSASASSDPSARQRFLLGMVLMYLNLIPDQPQKYRALLVAALRQRIVELGDPSVIQGDIRARVEAVLPGYLFRRRFAWAFQRVRRSWRRWRGRQQRMR